ncbi:MAG TPA: GLPGLI family protein [Sphingobacterium sp.]|nr:GLPGLI family protein [Sphingobacterium sp.]
MFRIIHIAFIFLIFICSKTSLFAQHAYFPYQGTVHYEKTIFIKNLMKRFANYESDESKRSFYNRFIDQTPENQVYKKKLSFSTDEVLFEHVKEEYSEVIKQLAMMGIFESGITTYQNLKSKEVRSSFELGGQDIYIQDSLVRTKWKITNEYRTIAGYNCRRANGVVMDSIYVVAFYTDEIPVSAGPACFNGLPGMILGMAVPELHYNIFATEVDLTPVNYINTNIAKRKAKPMTRQEVYDQLNMAVGQFLGERIFNLVMTGYFL